MMVIFIIIILLSVAWSFFESLFLLNDGKNEFQMHADDFREDRYNMVTGLRCGGYSDDMTLAAVAGMLYSFHMS